MTIIKTPQAAAVTSLNNPDKWRGGFEDLTREKAPLVIWDIPCGWLDLARRPQRAEALKEMLVWALGADLVEGLPELDEALFDQLIIPVRLTEKGRCSLLDVSHGRGVAWVAGLTENGIQMKLFARSRFSGEFGLLSVKFRRPPGSFDQFTAEAERWRYGVIAEWRDSLPEIILDAIAN